MRLKLPHISRIFSAGLFSLLLTLIGFNIFRRVTVNLAYSDKIIDVFHHPFSAAAHNNLAQAFRSSGNRVLANYEHSVVTELNPVLGASMAVKTEYEESQTAYWENILTTHPDYRDAYIQLALSSYRKGNITLAYTYLLKAQSLDPNNPEVNRLCAFTSKLLE